MLVLSAAESAGLWCKTAALYTASLGTWTFYTQGCSESESPEKAGSGADG